MAARQPSHQYQYAWAFEEVSSTCLATDTALDYEQRVRAATMLLVVARTGTWAGLGSDLSRWPAGDPVHLIVANIHQHDQQHHLPALGTVPAGYDTASLHAVLNATVQDIDHEQLPAPNDLGDYDARLVTEMTTTYRDVTDAAY